MFMVMFSVETSDLISSRHIESSHRVLCLFEKMRISSIASRFKTVFCFLRLFMCERRDVDARFRHLNGSIVLRNMLQYKKCEAFIYSKDTYLGPSHRSIHYTRLVSLTLIATLDVPFYLITYITRFHLS